MLDLQSPPVSPAAPSSAPPAPGSANQASAAAAAHARLVVPRADALRVLKAQVEKGLEIKRSKLRYVADLERARAAKGDWTAATMTLLKGLFSTSAVADDCQNWVGKVLPEYADLNLFIEHFYDEMDQRIRKLHGVWKRVQELPDDSVPTVTQPASASIAVSAPAAAAPARPAAPAQGNPDFFDVPAARHPAAAAAAPSMVRARIGALIVYEHDARSAAALRDFCKKLGFEVIDVVTDDPSRPTLAEQLDAQANLDFGLILSCGGSSESGPGTPAPFELGYCVGRLGLKRVFVLNPTEEKAQFDGHGLLHIPLDPA